MIRATTYGAGRTRLEGALMDREPFTTGGALRGDTYPNGTSTWESGRLSGEDLDTFKQDASTITYIVFSYATPIAWVTRSGKVHHVAQRFSPTTSKHQGAIGAL